MLLQRNLEQDRDQVAALEEAIVSSRLVAPFSGVVSGVQVRSGDPLDRGLTVLTLARPGDPIVTADINSPDTARIAVGQQATVLAEGSSGTEYAGTIIGLADAPGGVGRTAQLQVTWTTTPPAFGHTVQALVTLQEKADVLLVPQRAVRSSGQRRYVEYMDGGSRRTIDVAVGIVGPTDVEILSGLREGQLILLGTSGSGPTPSNVVPSSGTTP